MSDNDRFNDRDRELIREIYRYTERAGSGLAGKLTATPASAAITVLVIMCVFIIIMVAFATNNDELLLRLLSLSPGMGE